MSQQKRLIITVSMIFLGVTVLFNTGCATSSSGLQQGKVSFLEGNYQQAYSQLAPLARRGNPEAQYALGYMYYYGQGVAQNEQLSRQWIQKAAEQNYPPAVKALAVLYKSDQTQVAQAKQNTAGKVSKTASAATTSHAQAQAKQVKPQVVKTAKTNTTQTNVAKAQKTQAVATKKTVTHAATSQAATSKLSQPPLLTATNSYGKTAASHGNGKYTLQLMGDYRKSTLQKYAAQHHLQDEVMYYHTIYQGKDWYIMTYGHYPSPHAAVAAIKKLPGSIQHLQPWVRPVATIKPVVNQAATRMNTPAKRAA